VVAWCISLSIVTPVAELEGFLKLLNRYGISEEIPEIEGGSLEVSRVQETIEHLIKLVRFANTAFYSGDLRKACNTLEEARRLFTKLENKKAVGIVDNNLGNLMLTLYRILKKTGVPKLCDLSKETIVEQGCKYFNNAIDLGEEALARINDEVGFSANYLIFMQQLSNRFFNRGLFLLTIRDDHPDPDETEKQGWIDLSTCKAMDREVVDNGDREGFEGERDIYFEVLLARIKGMLSLMKLGYDDDWGIDELFDEARTELKAALREPGHTLFADMDPAGQMQRLDETLIDFYLHHDDEEGEDRDVQRNTNIPNRGITIMARGAQLEKAAAIGIRMLVEDDFVIADSALLALKALIEFVKANRDDDFGAGVDPSDLQSSLFRYRQQVAESLSLSLPSGDLVSQETFRMSNFGDFSMEFF